MENTTAIPSITAIPADVQVTATSTPYPPVVDLKYLLAAAIASFLTVIALTMIHGCGDTIIGVALGIGGTAVGGMVGVSKGGTK